MKYEHEFVFGYEGISRELGLSVSTLKRMRRRGKLVLSKWGHGKTSTIYISRLQYVKIMLGRLLSS